MTQINPPGYPLPDGELGEDEIVCQLVYLPDRPEYWQALLAAVHYFSTWTAWERDDDKRGKDAAANWRSAFELTIGCWRMTCLEDLTQAVEDILELLQTRKDCCDDNITYLPVDDIETDIVPFEGDPPDVYGETEIEDWDEWAEHVCYNAHLYVDYLAHAGDSLWDAAKTGSIIIGLIAAILVLLSTAGIGAPVAYGLAAGIVSGIVLGGQINTFAGTSEAIEAARDDIICAILQGTGIAAAVEDALESGLDWDLFYQFIPYESAMSIIYEGGHDSEFLPAETRDDCVCDPVYDYSLRWDWVEDIEDPWLLYQDAEWINAYGRIKMAGNARLDCWTQDMFDYISEPNTKTIYIQRIMFKYKVGSNGAPRLLIVHDGGSFSYYYDGVGEPGEWFEEEIFFDPPLEVSHPTNPFMSFRDSSSGNLAYNWWTELDIDVS